MKTLKSIIAIAAISFSVPANAAPLYAPHEREAFCPAIENLANKMMTARQAGMSMGAMIEYASRMSGRVKAVNVALIMKAFEVPQYSTREYKDRAATEFGNAAMLSCYKDGIEV